MNGITGENELEKARPGRHTGLSASRPSFPVPTTNLRRRIDRQNPRQITEDRGVPLVFMADACGCIDE